MEIEKIIQDVKTGKAIILDVREREEWDEGHIKGAMHYSLGRIQRGEIPAIPKDILIYTHCRAGVRGAEAAEALMNAGFTQVVCLGGYEDWKSAGGNVIE
ncbi:MAG: rhodanese-like domain-containing protein [Candidatus Paceibacterota bacterium]